MVDIIMHVLISENGETQEYDRFELSAVPRVGEQIYTKGTSFTVKHVHWYPHHGGDVPVGIDVLEDRRGYDFPMPDAN